MRVLLAAILLALPSFGALAAEPVGHYLVTGTGPSGGSKYSGQVTVKQTGQTYEVVWVIGDTTYVGTGIGNDEFMTVSYKSGNDTGLALYDHDGDGWKGIWTYAGGTSLGIEKWTRE